MPGVIYSSKDGANIGRLIELSEDDLKSLKFVQHVDLRSSGVSVTTKGGIPLKLSGVATGASDKDARVEVNYESSRLLAARLNLLSLIEERASDLSAQSVFGETIAALFDAGMEKLDSPENHIAYIREKIEEASQRGVG